MFLVISISSRGIHIVTPLDRAYSTVVSQHQRHARVHVGVRTTRATPTPPNRPQPAFNARSVPNLYRNRCEYKLPVVIRLVISSRFSMCARAIGHGWAVRLMGLSRLSPNLGYVERGRERARKRCGRTKSGHDGRNGERGLNSNGRTKGKIGEDG